MVAGFKRTTWTVLSSQQTVVKQSNASVHSFMQSSSRKLVYAKEAVRLCPDLVVCPAGLPHTQSLGVGELSLEAEQDPAMAEEQLQAVLPQPGEVLVEAGQHETQQLPQVHLRAGQRGNTVSQTQTFIF